MIWPFKRFKKDPVFRARAQSAVRFDHLLLVEIGAAEHTVLVDTLEQISQSDAEFTKKSSMMIGLRLQALAMSLRTNRGRVPFEYSNEKDLMRLALYPNGAIVAGLEEVAALCDMPWLSASLMAERAALDDEHEEGASMPSRKASSENP